jgi:hypothetical protein
VCSFETFIVIQIILNLLEQLSLGAGLGVSGLKAAQLGASRVVLSDNVDELLMSLNLSVTRNCSNEAKLRMISVKSCDWSFRSQSNPSEFSNTSAAVMHPDHSTEPVCLGTVRSEVESVALRTLVEIGGRGYPRCNITDNINLRAFHFVRATLGYMMRKLENISYGTLNHRRERRKFVRKTKVITSGLQTELYNGVTEGESSKLLVSASVISRFCHAK